MTLKDGTPNDGKDLRERIKKDSKSIPLGASLRWAINASEGGFLQLQVERYYPKRSYKSCKVGKVWNLFVFIYPAQKNESR